MREIYLLVGECRELGADMILWRRHLMEGLDRLIGDHVTIYSEGVWPGRTIGVVPRVTLDCGWESDNAQRFFHRFMKDLGPEGDPSWSGFHDFFKPPLHTGMRKQLVDDAVYYNSPCYNDYKRKGYVDDCIVSLGVPDDRRYDILTLHRRLRGRDWTEREVKIVNLLHQEILPMIGRELASVEDHNPTPLSPRLEQTLFALLDGLDERGVADRLDLSQHTVHQYVKALYERYCVHSRGELLALWIRRHQRRRPISAAASEPRRLRNT